MINSRFYYYSSYSKGTEFNKSANLTKHWKVRDSLEAMKEIIDEELFLKLGMSTKIEIKENDIHLLAKRSTDNVNALTNPRSFNLSDIEDIIRNIFKVV